MRFLLLNGIRIDAAVDNRSAVGLARHAIRIEAAGCGCGCGAGIAQRLH
jgi:hypothetical protein